MVARTSKVYCVRILLLLKIKRLTLYGHIKTAEQPTIIQQYGDSYTGR